MGNNNIRHDPEGDRVSSGKYGKHSAENLTPPCKTKKEAFIFIHFCVSHSLELIDWLAIISPPRIYSFFSEVPLIKCSRPFHSGFPERLQNGSLIQISLDWPQLLSCFFKINTHVGFRSQGHFILDSFYRGRHYWPEDTSCNIETLYTRSIPEEAKWI